MRVTLVTPGFPPELGGVEAHTGHLVRELTALGVGMRVLTARRGLRRPLSETRDGVQITTYPAWRTRVMSISPGLLFAALRASRDADLIHVHSYHATCGFATLIGFRAPVVFTPHYHGGGHSTGAVLLHRGYRFVGKLVFRAAHAVICVSRAERDLVVRDFPATATRTGVVPNGVDLAALRAAEPFPGEPRTIVSLGRLEPYKRVATLLRALVDIPPDVQLVVIGDGSQLEELRELTGDLRVAERVRFTGPLSTTDVHRWLRTARVLVSLSEHEAFGMAPVEAAAAGAGVVLSDIPAHREITADHLGTMATLTGTRPSDVAAAVTARLDATERTEADVPGWARIARQTLAVYHSVRRTDRKDSTP
ncbi:glycosyltransferase family 4 protein [Umezawaea sp. Da 62-37]|uniref:glycosyltransferase family 4 protein n=1 Tax=Umezawaea sp. Da 62-37 TaxID=3075927 RepID=UPI0028F72E42|nr:glycosyltransferase family 4 protein [Umezawaea sp. Da 62-37]WNV85112.1 glycosyltransferase family 4 protein [Umezawaea sp. Da 62-37]